MSNVNNDKKAGDFAKDYIKGLKDVLDRIPLGPVDEIVQAIELAQNERRQIFVIGNGGSAATASHMMNDLNKGTLGHKGDATWKRFKVIALTDNVSLMTAWANDTLGHVNSTTVAFTVSSAALVINFSSPASGIAYNTSTILVNLTTSVAPGATVNISVNLTAPTTPGHETDLSALAKGKVTITPLDYNLTRKAVLREMEQWQFRLPETTRVDETNTIEAKEDRR